MTSAAASLFAFPIRIYFEDTDATGVVYHANYLRYFERARTEWMRARGRTHDVMLKDHSAVFTLSELAIKYRKPARLGDELEATVAIVETSRISLTFAQTLRRSANPAEILATASATVVCVDAASFKPRAWPAGWLAE